MICPLCSHSEKKLIEAFEKKYFHCNNCDLIYMDKSFHLSPSLEKKHYDFHENNYEDENYKSFLNQLVDPMLDFISSEDLGLDFGSGPSPVLSMIFNDHQIKCENYDLYYQDDKAVFNKKYNFITSSEVFEHLSNPRKIIEFLLQQLKPFGVLGIMTDLHDEKDFSNWHYPRDPTHICFYSKKTFHFIAEKYSLEIAYSSKRVHILKS